MKQSAEDSGGNLALSFASNQSGRRHSARIQLTMLLVHCSIWFLIPVNAMPADDMAFRIANAKKFLHQKNLAKGRALLLSLINDPNCPADAYTLLAGSYLEGAMYDMPTNLSTVEQWIAIAKKKNPNSGTAYVLSAYAYNFRSDYPKAIDEATKGLTAKDPDERGFCARAIIYAHMKKYPQARQDMQEFVARGHRTSIDYMLLGDMQRAENKFAEAADSYHKAIQTTGAFQIRIVNSMIDCLVAAKQTDKAILEISNQLNLNTDDSQLLDKRGGLYQSQKKFALALADYSKAISIEPEPLYLKHRASLYEVLGKKDLAAADRGRADKSGQSDKLF